jgi:hypothetical protein
MPGCSPFESLIMPLAWRTEQERSSPMPGPARYREAQRANALRSGFYGLL